MRATVGRATFGIIGMLLASVVTADASLSVPVHGPRSEAMLPVSLKCPAENRGILEVVSQSAAGAIERLSVVFDIAGPTRLLISYGFLGSFDKPDEIDLVGKDEVEGAAEIASYAESLRANICLAPPGERERAYMTFEANRSILSEGQ